MSSTPQQIPKGPRRSGKKNKGQHIQNDTLRSAVSDNEVSIQQNVNNVNGKGRRKSLAPNKAHTSGNVSDNPMPTKTQATPIKSAYAGPTFHHSPAASALPLPSFYSKSVPSKPAPIVEDHEQDDITPPDVGTPSKRESTPLDFLFDAARQQNGTPRAESPAARSIPARSPAGRSPAPREGDMFPFELDGATTPGEDGTPFAPSYRDCINSAKSTRSTSIGVRDMDEEERKAKTDALKKLLYLSPSPTPPQSSHDPNNPFNARAAPQRPYSGHSNSPYPNQYPAYNRPSSRDQAFANQIPRPQSHLRYEAPSDPEPAELSSDSALTPPRVSTARREGTMHYQQGGLRDIPPYNPNSRPQHHHAPGPPPMHHMQPPWSPTSPPPSQPMHHYQHNYGPPQHQQHHQPGPPNGYRDPNAGPNGAPISTARNDLATQGAEGGGPQQQAKPTARQMEDQLRSVLNMGGLKLGS